MQTLEGVSAQAKYIGSISAALKTLPLPEIPAICEALDRFQTQRVKQPASAGISEADRLPVGQHPGSHVPQQKTAQAVENSPPQNPVPLKSESCRHMKDQTAVSPLQLHTGQEIDQVLPFFFENSATQITCLIPIKARQSVSAEVKAMVAGCEALDAKTKKYIAFLHPASCCPSLNSNASCAIDTIYVVFRRKAYPGAFSGVFPLQAPAFKVRNYHNLGKSKGRIFKIKG